MFPGLFALVALASKRLAGDQVRFRPQILRLSYVLVPIGILALLVVNIFLKPYMG